jgi:hypothetical protein
LALKEGGISVTPAVESGMNFIEFEPGVFESRIKFRCCTGCYLPIDSKEAAWLNDQIGLELPSAESLQDRMKRLKSKVNGFK